MKRVSNNKRYIGSCSLRIRIWPYQTKQSEKKQHEKRQTLLLQTNNRNIASTTFSRFNRMDGSEREIVCGVGSIQAK